MIKINKNRLINEFFELVQINSETMHEERIAKTLIEKCKMLGLQVIQDASRKKICTGANNIICHLKGSKQTKKTIFFAAHMDTVCPGDKIKPSISNGWIVSDGTTILGADDKAAIAAIMEAIRVLKESNIEHGDIQFIFTVGEESGLIGAKTLEQAFITSEFGYVLDSVGAVGGIVVASPTQAKLHMNIKKPKNQKKIPSLVTIMRHAIANMTLGKIDHCTTATIHHFEGGYQPEDDWDHLNIIADVTSLEKEKVENQIRKMNRALKTTARTFGAYANVEVEIMYPNYRHNKEDEVVKIFRHAVKDIGRNCNFLTSNSGSDANIISSYGIPTANLSVGYENIHTTKERIAIEELVKLTELIIAIAKEVSK